MSLPSLAPAPLPPWTQGTGEAAVDTTQQENVNLSLMGRENESRTSSSTWGAGMRTRSPPTGSTAAETAIDPRKPQLLKASNGGDEGRRELSFWGFAKQLSTHKNFWL